MIASDAPASWPTVATKQGTGAPTPPWTSRWTVTRDAGQPDQLGPESPPNSDIPFAEPFGDGVLFAVRTSDAPGTSPPLAYLPAPGDGGGRGGVWNRGAWQLVDHDPDAALLVRVGIDGLEIGFLDVSASAINLSAGTLFGYEIGELSSDEVLAAPAPYAPLANDSGWFVTERIDPDPNEPDCLAGLEQRVIWWGDTSMAFFRFDDGREELWSWTTGDVRASGWDDRRQPDIPTSEVSLGIDTTLGTALGTTVDEFLTAHGGTMPLQDAEPDGTRIRLWQPEAGQGGKFFIGITVAADGLISGIGATRSFC